jgi:membrane-anchored mycosin MYCP
MGRNLRLHAHRSGVAALIRSKWPEMTAKQVINRIVATAKDAGAPGKDPLYGFGVLNAEAALKDDVPEVSANPLGSIADWIRVHRRGNLATPAPLPTAEVPSEGPPCPRPTVPVAKPPSQLDSALRPPS